MEVAFTALCEFKATGDLSLQGKSYIWMFPIYALIVPAMRFLRPRVGSWAVYARVPLYVLLLYIVEYATGWALRLATGTCPWDYGDARWAVQGVIRLDYAPAWAAAVYLFETVYLWLEPPPRKA